MVCPLNFYIKRISKLSDFRVEGFETRLIFCMYAAIIVVIVAAMRTSNCSLCEILLELSLEPRVRIRFI